MTNPSPFPLSFFYFVKKKGCSLLGTFIPLLLARYQSTSLTALINSCVKLVGAGVILATAFVHMLMPADQVCKSLLSSNGARERGAFMRDFCCCWNHWSAFLNGLLLLNTNPHPFSHFRYFNRPSRANVSRKRSLRTTRPLQVWCGVCHGSSPCGVYSTYAPSGSQLDWR